MTRIFIPYSEKDEARKSDFEKHLSVLRRHGYIETWTSLKVDAENQKHESPGDFMAQARVVLPLLSPDLIASGYCRAGELETALERHHREEAVVIPILLRRCDLQHTPFNSLEMLPSDPAIEEWENSEDAYAHVISGIKTALRKLNGEVTNHELDLVETPAQELLASLKRRAMHATDASDFRILLFDVHQFKLEHRNTPGIEEIERMVRNGLAFETQTTSSFKQVKTRNAISSTQMFRHITLFGLLLLVTLTLMAWRYLH